MAFSSISLIGAQPIADVSTTQKHPFGTIVTAFDPTYGEGEFVYVKGVSSGAAGLMAIYDPYDGTTTLTTTRSKGICGVMMAALDATTDYGWLQIGGVANATTPDTITQTATPYLHATAGNVSDSVVAGDIIYNSKFQAADATGRVLIALARPFCGDTDNS